MQGPTRVVAFVLMVLILIFAIIHLGVSIGIVARLNYSGVFRPERGLAGFNIVISIYALIVGGFGLFAVLTDRDVLCKIVAIGSVALAFFTIVSLITALIINSKAVDYSSSHFLDHMSNYKNNQDSKAIVDIIQTKYTCCGDDTWLDWAAESLNATANTANDTTSAPSSNETTTTSGVAGATKVIAVATTVAGLGTTTRADSGTAIAAGSGTDAGTATAANGEATIAKGRRRKRNVIVEAIIDTDTRYNDVKSQRSPRQKRQSQSYYGGILGLPTTFAVTMPLSCCTTDFSATDSLTNLYCISNANNGTGGFHLDGCGKKVAQIAVGQSLGIAVINSLLFLIALAAVPVCFQPEATSIQLHNEYVQEPEPQHQPQKYAYDGTPAAVYDPGTSINNYSTGF